MPTARYYTASEGEGEGDRHQWALGNFDVSQLGYAPWGATDDKGAQSFTQEGVDEARKFELEGVWLHEYTGDDVNFVLAKLAPELPALRSAGLDFNLTADDVTLGLGAERELALNALTAGARASRLTPDMIAAGDYLG